MTGPAVDVEQLQGLLEKATGGEWKRDDWSNGDGSHLSSNVQEGAYDVAVVYAGSLHPDEGDREAQARANADYIAAAHNALPALLDLIRRQDAALTAVRQLHFEGPYKDCRECSHAWPCPTVILASPRTARAAGA